MRLLSTNSSTLQGFKMFSDLKVSEDVTTGGGQVEEVTITTT